MTREEAYVLLESLKRGFENQAKILEALELRVKILERGKRSTRKPSPDVQKTLQNELADLWIAIYKGKPPGQLFKIGTQLWKDYGGDRVLPVLRYVFRKTPITYMSLPKIASAFETYEGEMKAFRGNGQGGGETAPPDPYAAAREWISGNGGVEKVTSVILGLAKAEDGPDRFRNALAKMEAPNGVLVLVGPLLQRGTI